MSSLRMGISRQRGTEMTDEQELNTSSAALRQLHKLYYNIQKSVKFLHSCVNSCYCTSSITTAF